MILYNTTTFLAIESSRLYDNSTIGSSFSYPSQHSNLSFAGTTNHATIGNISFSVPGFPLPSLYSLPPHSSLTILLWVRIEKPPAVLGEPPGVIAEAPPPPKII